MLVEDNVAAILNIVVLLERADERLKKVCRNETGRLLWLPVVLAHHWLASLHPAKE